MTIISFTTAAIIYLILGHRFQDRVSNKGTSTWIRIAVAIIWLPLFLIVATYFIFISDEDVNKGVDQEARPGGPEPGEDTQENLGPEFDAGVSYRRTSKEGSSK